MDGLDWIACVTHAWVVPLIRVNCPGCSSFLFFTLTLTLLSGLIVCLLLRSGDRTAECLS